MADRVYMYTKSTSTYMCTYIVHDCTYSAKLLRIAVYTCIYIVWRVLDSVSMVLGSESRALLGVYIIMYVFVQDMSNSTRGNTSTLPECKKSYSIF